MEGEMDGWIETSPNTETAEQEEREMLVSSVQSAQVSAGEVRQNTITQKD